MPNNGKSMINEKGKKSHRDLIQDSDLPKTDHFYRNRNGSLLTKISFADNLQTKSMSKQWVSKIHKITLHNP